MKRRKPAVIITVALLLYFAAADLALAVRPDSSKTGQAGGLGVTTIQVTPNAVIGDVLKAPALMLKETILFRSRLLRLGREGIFRVGYEVGRRVGRFVHDEVRSRAPSKRN